MGHFVCGEGEGAADSPAGLDGFRGETASDVGFARAGEGLFPAIHVHVSVYAWSLLDPGQEDIMFTSTLHLSSLLYLFFPPAPHSCSLKSLHLQTLLEIMFKVSLKKKCNMNSPTWDC